MTEQEKKGREYVRINKPLAYKKIMNYEKQLLRNCSIAVMQIQLTYNCNFKCKHCMTDELKHQSHTPMTIDEIEGLCNQAHDYGLAQIDLSGGEPLIHKDLGETLLAIGTDRFYISLATNGWLMTQGMATWLKEMGVDRILMSLDSLNEKEHDEFRRHTGSWKQTVKAIDFIKNAGLDLKIMSLITKKRLYSKELPKFLNFLAEKGTRIEAMTGKPMGRWAGRTDIILSSKDLKYLQEHYDIQIHTSKHFGQDLGCPAVRKMILATAFGEITPCPYMMYSIGNIRKQSLNEILIRGMSLFGEYHSTCRMMEDKDFLKKYFKKTMGKRLPVPIYDKLENEQDATWY